MSQLVKLSKITAEGLLSRGKTRKQIMEELEKLYGGRFEITNNTVYCKMEDNSLFKILEFPDKIGSLGDALAQAFASETEFTSCGVKG